MASLNPISSVANLGRERAAHLLRRTTFGPTRQDIDTFANYTIDQALAILLDIKELPVPPTDPATGESWVNPRPGAGNSEEDDLKEYVKYWWGDLMINDGNSIIEKMVWWYHTHLTTIISRVPESTAVYNQLALFRFYALGNFKTACNKVCYDNAMLYNLDGRLNVKGNVQENFSREFFELYTIGKGPQLSQIDYTNYTEEDVKAGARLLSGFDVDTSFTNIDEESGVALGILKGNGITANQHDLDPKTFSNKFQSATLNTTSDAVADVLAELQEFVDMIFNQDETARYICRRLYRFFVYYQIPEEVENDIITPLAATFRNNDYELLPVLDQLLRSQHFFDEDNGITTDDNIGAIIKSPLDLTLGALRYFNVQMPDKSTDLVSHYEAWGRILNPWGIIAGQGLNFYEPFDVVGYEAYHQVPAFNRNWISPNNLMQRYQLSSPLVDGTTNEDGELLFQINIYPYMTNQGVNLDDENAIVQHFVDNMFPEPITQERFDYFVTVLLNGEELWSTVAENPDLDIITEHLRELTKALLASPEYQLM